VTLLANFSCVTPLELKQSLSHSSPSLVHHLCEIGSDPKCICIELEHLVVLVIVFAAGFLVSLVLVTLVVTAI
jgi:hypothetical protein